MPVISSNQQLHTVIVTVDAPPEVMEDLVAHAIVGLQRFPECDGFVGGALHVSDDGTRLVQYLQWASETAYVACRDDPAWDRLPSTGPFMAHVTSGRAVIDARGFDVVASTN